MRIEAYTQVQQIYKTSKTDKSQRKPGVGATVQLQISAIEGDIRWQNRR